MGTMLYSKGVFISRCFDEMNLSNPDLVREVHQDYIKAGVDIIETNTFGGNRMKLMSHGLADQIRTSTSEARGSRATPREKRMCCGGDWSSRYSDRTVGKDVHR